MTITERGSSTLDAYDAGLLSDYGGGDVGWWQDYIRAELGRAHDHYQAQVDNQDQAGTWSDGGKEWTPDEVSFKAGWDKAKQLLKPEDFDGLDEAAARITELEEALRPFANAAHLYRNDNGHNNMAARSGFSGRDAVSPFIPVSALRSARAALGKAS